MASSSSYEYHPEGSVSVVTGAASGIGRSICYHLIKLGARDIIAVDLDISKLRKAFNDKGINKNTNVTLLEADVSSEMDIRRVIQKTETEIGQIDAFFCNAGILGGGFWGGGPEVSNDEWNKMWQINVMQSVYTARHLFPLYKDRGGGALMITGSAAGLLTLAGNLPYSVTKHAAVAVAEWLRMSYNADNINVSCLCPQGVNTNMLAGHDPTTVWGGGELLSPDRVAEITIDAMTQNTFMVLPHPEVGAFFKFKAKDYDLWLQKMMKVHQNNIALIQQNKRPRPKL